MAISGISGADAAAITALQTRQQIDTAVLKKVHDSAEAQGEAAIALLEAAAQAAPSAGEGHIDVIA